MDDDVDLWVDAYLLIGGISLHTHTHTEPHTSGFRILLLTSLFICFGEAETSNISDL